MILDSETYNMIEIAKREAPFAMLKQTGIIAMGDDVPLRPEIEQWLRGRVEWVKAGVERCPEWFRKTLKRFDDTLRVRWDFYNEYWVIERIGGEPPLYRRCGTWDSALGERLIETLRKSDMTRKSPDEHIQEAEDRAAAQRAQNEKKSKEGFLAAVDGMTNRQCEDFVEVSRALEHGESLSFAGPDADLMNKIWDEKKKNPDLASKPMPYRKKMNRK